MSFNSPNQRRLDWWLHAANSGLKAMDRYNKELLSDLIISGFVVSLTVLEGANPTASVAALTIINTITVSQILTAFREIQAENREDHLE